MGKRFFVHLRHPLTGKQFQLSALTERELAALRHRVESLRTELSLDMISRDEVDRKLRRLRYGAVTLARAAESYRRREDLSNETRKRIATCMRGPLAPIALFELDALDASRLGPLFESLCRKHTDEGLRTLWRTLRSLVRHAAERGWTARVPWGPWRPRLRSLLPAKPLRECARSRDELILLIETALQMDREDVAAKRPYRALGGKTAAMGYLGLRQGELAGLQRGDIDERAQTVSIVRQWGGRRLKAGSATLEVPPHFFQVIRMHELWIGRDPVYFDVGPQDVPLFPLSDGSHQKGGEPLTTSGLRQAVRRAGLPHPERWSPHSLRDSFCTIEARERRGDWASIQPRTRHATIASCARYVRPFLREEEGAFRLPPAASK